MSDYGDVIDVTEIKKEAEEMQEKAQGFWEKNGAKIALGVSLVASFLLNRKIGRLENKTIGAFKKTEKVVNDLVDYTNNNFNALYGNARIVRADISNVATFVGFQGKLGVNNITED